MHVLRRGGVIKHLLMLLTLVLSLFSQDGRRLGYISGVWSDACPCKAPCPCWKTHRSSSVRCVNFHVFKVEHGEVGGYKLTGAIFVLLNLPKAPHSAPTADTLFIDSKVSEDKAAVIESVILSHLGPLHVQSVAMKLDSQGDRQQLNIPGILAYAIETQGASPPPSVADFLYPWLTSAKQGRVRFVKYVGEGNQSVEYLGTNALMAQFHFTSE